MSGRVAHEGAGLNPSVGGLKARDDTDVYRHAARAMIAEDGIGESAALDAFSGFHYHSAKGRNTNRGKSRPQQRFQQAVRRGTVRGLRNIVRLEGVTSPADIATRMPRHGIDPARIIIRSTASR
jgi:ABC-type branched-subunit amino acid transport system ATPase component